MSWDVFVVDIPDGAKSLADISPEFVPGPIPARAVVLEVIREIVPSADFTDPTWIQVTGPDANLEISIGDAEPLMGFAFHVRGGDQSVALIAAILDRLGLRALDPGSDTGIFDPSTADSSLENWRTYRAQVVSHAKASKNPELAPHASGTEQAPTIKRYPCIVIAKIMDTVQPLERGSKYEDPLSAAMASAKAGSVIGGGSQLNADLEVVFVDIELALADLEDALQVARSTLERLGAPEGSVLLFLRDGEPRALPVAAGALEQVSTEVSDALRRRLIPTDRAAPTATMGDSTVVREAAKKILASFEQLCIDDQQFEAVDAARYPPEKREWYDRVGDELAQAGFRVMGHWALAAFGGQKIPQGERNFSRKLLSADGRIRADMFAVTPAAKGKVPVRVVVLGTEFEGSNFLTTSTAKPKWNTANSISAAWLPPDTSVAALLALHRRRLSDALQSNAGLSVVVLHSQEDILNSEARVRRENAALKRRQGIPTLEELVRLGAKLPVAQQIHDEMRRLLESRNS